MHAYHVIQELCEKHNIKCDLMPGSTLEHATFKMTSKTAGAGWQLTTYGSCGGTVITLGVPSRSRKKFDLNDPESLDQIDQYLEVGTMWSPERSK